MSESTSDREMWCIACHEMVPCRFAPSPDAGPHWRCSQCGEIIAGRPPEWYEEED